MLYRREGANEKKEKEKENDDGLMCNDESIETMLRSSRSRGAKSSRSFRL